MSWKSAGVTVDSSSGFGELQDHRPEICADSRPVGDVAGNQLRRRGVLDQLEVRVFDRPTFPPVSIASTCMVIGAEPFWARVGSVTDRL